MWRILTILSLLFFLFLFLVNSKKSSTWPCLFFSSQLLFIEAFCLSCLRSLETPWLACSSPKSALLFLKRMRSELKAVRIALLILKAREFTVVRILQNVNSRGSGAKQVKGSRENPYRLPNFGYPSSKFGPICKLCKTLTDL